MAVFDYLIIFDFEATCDTGDKPKVTRENQEIIEFPWIVLRLSDNKIIHKEQYFIRPVLTKGLTEFCTKLTGITTEQVEKAPTLEEVLLKFENFLTLLESNQIQDQQPRDTPTTTTNTTTTTTTTPTTTTTTTDNGNENQSVQLIQEDKKIDIEEKRKKKYCILTDGDWDIKYMLLAESKRKKFSLSEVWYSYFNLREEFRKKYYPSDKSTQISLKRMLSHLKLSFVGHHHSGLDDCTNIAAVCQKLIENGHKFIEGEVISKDYDPTKDVDIKDYSLSGPKPFDIPTETTEVLRMRGLPWAATIRDVQNFFAPIHVQSAGVNLFVNANGRSSGEGCVVFSSIQDAQQALTLKNRQVMLGRYIELFPCTLEQIKKISEAISAQM